MTMWTRIVCDAGCPDYEHIQPGEHAREVLAKYGWSSEQTPRGVVDYCPKHTRERTAHSAGPSKSSG